MSSREPQSPSTSAQLLEAPRRPTTTQLRAMATRITIQLGEPGPAWARDDIVRDAMTRAAEVFTTVDATCTRFSASSPLMQMNRSPETWNVVPRMLYDAIYEAKLAYSATNGLFDPRVLQALLTLGYATTLDFNGGDVRVDETSEDALQPLDEPWNPEFAEATSSVLPDASRSTSVASERA